jgi:hypothetical protein
VRSIIRLTLASAAVTAVACGGKDKPTASMTDDLKRDLQLATSVAPNVTVNADELAPQSQKAVALKLKKAPGPKVIRSQTPTVKASVAPREVAEIKNDIPEVQMVASAPAPSETVAPMAPPAARPAPLPLPASGPGPNQGSMNGGGSGGGIGGILGGIFGGGVVIRGGPVGDDHCDPRTDGRRGRPSGGYIPNGGMTPVGGIGGIRGVPGRPRM